MEEALARFKALPPVDRLSLAAVTERVRQLSEIATAFGSSPPVEVENALREMQVADWNSHALAKQDDPTKAYEVIENEPPPKIVIVEEPPIESGPPPTNINAIRETQGIAVQFRELLGKLQKITSDSIPLPPPDELDTWQKKVNEADQMWFRVAIAGEGKTGKSTFINALLGENVLASDQLPCTGNVCTIYYSKTISAKVKRHGEANLEPIVIPPGKQIANVLGPYTRLSPGQGCDFEQVNLYIPSAFLQNRVVLRDLPGLNQTTANTAMAQSALENSHAVIWVTDANKPLVLSERQRLKWLRKHLKHDRVFVVGNLFDRIQGNLIADDPEYTPEERHDDLERARERLKGELEKQVRECLPAILPYKDRLIHWVSAKPAGVNKQRKRDGRQLVNEPGSFARLEDELLKEIAERREILILAPLCTQLEAWLAELHRYIVMKLTTAQSDLAEKIKALDSKRELLRAAEEEFRSLFQADNNTLKTIIDGRVKSVLLAVDEWNSTTMLACQKKIAEWNPPRSRDTLEASTRDQAQAISDLIATESESWRVNILTPLALKQQEHLLQDLKNFTRSVTDNINAVLDSPSVDKVTLFGSSFKADTVASPNSPEPIRVAATTAAGGVFGALLGTGGAAMIGAGALFPPAAIAATVGGVLFGMVAYFWRGSVEDCVKELRKKHLAMVEKELARMTPEVKRAVETRLRDQFARLSGVVMNHLKTVIGSMQEQLEAIKLDKRSKEEIEELFQKHEPPLREMHSSVRRLLADIDKKAQHM